MLTDPLVVSVDSSVTAAGTSQESCPKNYAQGSKSVYAEAGGDISIEVSHQTTTAGRQRHLVKVQQKKIAADPYTAVNADVSATAHIVIDEPKFGFTDTELKDIVHRLVGLLTDANVDRLLNNES